MKEGNSDADHYSFAAAPLVEVLAHGGMRPIFTWRARAADGSVNFVDLTVVPPGGDIGVHTHADDNEEIYIIVAGRGTMTLDGRQIEVASGDVIPTQRTPDARMYG